MDNRPLRFEEFMERVNQVVFLSATTSPYEREISTQIAGMQASHVQTLGIGADEFLDDLVQRQRRGVDDPRIRRAPFEQRERHQRSGVKADRAGGDQVSAANRDQVRRARPGADEMDGHSSELAELATAQVAPFRARRATSSTAPSP